MRKVLLQTFILGLMVGCGTQDNSSPPNAGSGGTPASGGSTAGASGGSGGVGSSGGGTGGASASGTGGSGSGGNSVVATGGSKATGGSGAGKGGSSGVATGGSKATGGSVSGSGGNSGVATGGSGAGKGGNTSTSAPGKGGATGIVDASAGEAGGEICPAGSHTTSGKQYCTPPSNGSAGGNYTYDLWSDGKGSGCLTVYNVDATFKANWTNVGDWIARVGLSFDKTKTYDQIGTFSCDFNYTLSGVTSGGFGNIGIYGWTLNPLHEFYIAENWLGKKPNFTKVGSFTIDGEGTYEIMTNQQKNAPNITGTNQDFVQFWSVRSSTRQCGHISISKHFAEWASLGLQLGKLEEVRILIEGQNNSGTIDFTTAKVVVAK